MPELFSLSTERFSLTWATRRNPPVITPLIGAGAPGRLLVTPKRRDISSVEGTWKLKSDSPSVPITTGVGPRLFEQTDYSIFLRASSGTQVELRHRDPMILGDIRSSSDKQTSYGILNFGSQIGRSRFSVLVGGEAELDFEVEVFPTKLDYETDYLAIVADVQEILTGLALDYLRATHHLGVASRVPQPTDLEWITSLRSVVDQLESALHYVAANPIRRLDRNQESVRADRAKASDSLVRQAISRGHGVGALRKTRGGRWIHEVLPSRHVFLTLDTPEHRWLATQVRAIRRRLVRLRKSVGTERENSWRRGPESERSRRTGRELDELHAKLGRMESLEPLRGAGGQPPINFSSLQLMSAGGYREAYQAIVVLSLGLRVRGGPVELSVKDLNELYEYWCYLALLRLLEAEMGKPKNLQTLVRQDGGSLRVQLLEGFQTSVVFVKGDRTVTLTYNPGFSGVNTLVAQRPDMLISIEDEGWPRAMLVLDAKYRVSAEQSYVDRFGAPGPPEDALNVLHRYRDALLEADGHNQESLTFKRTVVQGAALYPYREPLSGEFQSTRLWSALASLGIGAIPMLPGELTYATTWLRSALTHGGWRLADLAIAHGSSDRAGKWRQASAEVALVTLRGDPGTTLEHRANGWVMITPLLPDKPIQFSTRHIGLVDSLGQRWGLASYAPVTSIDVRRVMKPGSQPQYQLVYEFGALVNRAPIHWSPGVDSVALPIWTSRLALERAACAEELLLSTETEWRLLEELRALGLDVSFAPADFDGPGAAMWLMAPNRSRARSLGAAGYAIRRKSGAEFIVARLEDVLDELSAT